MRDHAITLAAPAASSDEGLPLANGLLGALVWGDGDPLNISLDRTDLWDLREVPEFQAPDYRLDRVLEKHRAGRHDELVAELEAPYHRPGPTKLPAGRIELRVAGARFAGARLPLKAPVAEVDLGCARISAAVHAVRPVGFLRVEGGAPSLALRAPPFGGPPPGWTKPAGFDASHADVWDLGYPAPDAREGPGWQAFEQQGHGGFVFAAALVWEARDGGPLDACWSLATGPDALATALAEAREALAAGHEALRREHLAWWSERSALTDIAIPDADLEAAYAADLYKLDAAARPGAPPISLQGPWTVDNGRLPPWKGDYHHDLNTQMSYWPALTANRVEAHAAFLEWLWATRDACRDWTRRFFRVPGLNVPMTADLMNRQIGGWRQYTHSLASGAWLAHHFAQHWRCTRDAAFLANRAYPYLAEACGFIDAITARRGPDGRRATPISSSPEIHNNAPEAWFDHITNYDLALFRQALADAAELAEALGRADDAARWRAIDSELPPLAIENGRLVVAPREDLAESHRHFSHLMAIHPLPLLDPLGSPADMALARASLDHLRTLGTGMWMGYSFAWAACMHARVGDGNAALAALAAYRDGFLLPNSFHANGDFAGKGYSRAVFRAFTLEGNLAAAQAVHEMLLQSRDGVIRLFPALPTTWKASSFAGLRAERGLLVSAAWADGRLVQATVHAQTECMVRIAAGGNSEALEFAVRPGENRLDAGRLCR